MKPADCTPTLDPVVPLHAAVDRDAGRLHLLHAERLHCRRGCSACCVDDLTVFAVEAAPIRRNHAELLTHGVAHAEGACAFLDDEGACRIYAERPYVCRTQGLPLRWVEERDGNLVIMARTDGEEAVQPFTLVRLPSQTTQSDSMYALEYLEIQA